MKHEENQKGNITVQTRHGTDDILLECETFYFIMRFQPIAYCYKVNVCE